MQQAGRSSGRVVYVEWGQEVQEVPREQRSVRTWLGHVCVAVAVAWVWRSSWVVWREVEPVDVALSYGGLVVVAQGQMA